MNISRVTEFLNDPIVKAICQKGKLWNDKTKEPDFNPFTLISELYYRENFHSDIIRAILDPGESHKEGNLFLALL